LGKIWLKEVLVLADRENERKMILGIAGWVIAT
jgi:hypothetical protein